MMMIFSKIKQVVYWLFIALFSSLFYVYSEEADKVGDLLLANLFPGKVVIDQETISVAKARDGHFYLDVKLNGVSMKFLIDTGASSISINQKIAADIGININSLVFNRAYNTANGKVMAAVAPLSLLQIGDFTMKDLYVSVSKFNNDTPLLGMSFLTKLESYTFDGNNLHMKFKMDR